MEILKPDGTQIEIAWSKIAEKIIGKLNEIAPIAMDKAEKAQIANHINLEQIPAELLELKKFVGSTLVSVKENGHIQKKLGYWKQERNHLCLADILEKMQRGQCQAVNLVMNGSNMFAIDLDNISMADPEVKEILEKFPSYQEISFSCTGLHVLLKSDNETISQVKRKVKLSGGGDLEILPDLVGLTGDKIVSSLDHIATADPVSIQWLLDKYFAPKRRTETPETKIVEVSRSRMNEEQVISLAESDKDPKFSYVWNNAAEDFSANAMLLWQKIAFYLGEADRDRIYNIAVQSPHYNQLDRSHQEKWNRENYIPMEKIADFLTSHTTRHKEVACVDPGADRGKPGEKFFQYPFVELTQNSRGETRERIIITWENTAYLMDQLGYSTRKNEITRDVDIFRKNQNGEQKVSRGLDNFATYLEGHARKSNYNLDSLKILQHIDYIANNNKYNPYLEFLANCHQEWINAGKPETIEKAFDEIFELDPQKVKESDIPLLKSFWQKWLINACRLAGNVGQDNIECIGVLILQGSQGIGKTRFGKWLMPVKDLLCQGGKIDPDNKDTIIQITASAICELGEFGRSQKDIDGIKAFITSTKDRIRKPYARSHEDYFRHTAFYGTVNETDFLKDDTGNRRFMIVPLEDINQEAIKENNVAMVWGQAFDLALNGAIDYLTRAEIERQSSLNLQHKKYTELQQAIIDYFFIDLGKVWTDEKAKYQQSFTAKAIGEKVGFPNTSRKVGVFLNMLARQNVIPPSKIVKGYTVYTLKTEK